MTVPGWEQIHPMRPGTFSTFWVGMGIALGIVVGGTATILIVLIDPEPLHCRDRRESKGQ